jgi:hypothetical protein
VKLPTPEIEKCDDVEGEVVMVNPGPGRPRAEKRGLLELVRHGRNRRATPSSGRTAVNPQWRTGGTLGPSHTP